MRIVFFGSAELAVPSLAALQDEAGLEVLGVVTQPDRPAGRKRKLTACPVKTAATAMELEVCTPEAVGSDEMVAQLKVWKPELLVVVAYGQYIPNRILEVAPLRAINVHPSLLPKYRGAAPIQWALLNGDERTGVSIIDVAERMDAGDILAQEVLPIEAGDTAASLHDRCALVGADLLVQTIASLRAGTVERQPQNENEVVEIRKLSKTDGAIDWAMSAVSIHNRVRAFDPWPGSRCILPNGELLAVWQTVCVGGEGKPGELLDDNLTVATGSGALQLLVVQPPGGKRMQALEYLRGKPLTAGEQLG